MGSGEPLQVPKAQRWFLGDLIRRLVGGKEKSRLAGLALVQVELRTSGWGVMLVGPSSELGSPGEEQVGRLGVFSVVMPAHPPGMDLTVLKTQEVDFLH